MKSDLEKNLRDVIDSAICLAPGSKAVIVFDRDSELASLLTDAYQAVIPEALMIDFRATTPDQIRATIDTLSPKDLVILVQSTSFRLNEFRFRLELFNRHLATIEHPHLGRMLGTEQQIYIDALAYDPTYYRRLGPQLKRRIDVAKRIVLYGPGVELIYDTSFEETKLNIGDYREMKNVGGQFPIGEVFTEPTDLSGVNGTVKLFAFGGEEHRVIVPDEPVTVVIEKGLIVDTPNAPSSFMEILDQIRATEPLWVRELGFGMNRALTRTRLLNDIGSYERMCGIHLSLGQKHTVYSKPGFPKRASKYHVDVFPAIDYVTIDKEIIYQNETYIV